MKKIVFLFILTLLILPQHTAICQPVKNKTYSYEELFQTTVDYFKKNRFKQAIPLLEAHLHQFPDKLPAITFNLAICYGVTKNLNKGIAVLNFGLNNGAWYDERSFDGEFWQSYKKNKKFGLFLKQNILAKNTAIQNSKSITSIIKPINYKPEKTYPLFIALHGSSGNITDFKKFWKSEKLVNEYVIAYIQSSQLVAWNSYSWIDTSKIVNEISKAYFHTIKNYKISEEGIIIGGFSSGGEAALQILLKTEIPVKGFILYNPTNLMESDFENSWSNTTTSSKGVIITNQNDLRYPDHLKLSAAFQTNGIQHNFIETAGQGLGFPENFSDLIDQSINYIHN